MNENALLQDFIVETGEHLMAAERNVLNLAQQFEDTGMLNEIFRCIHTIKGSSEYLGLARIAELSHKLENLLDLLRRGECKVEAEVIDLLISANDRIAELVDDLSQNQQEQACIEDLVSRIDTYTKNAVLMSATEAVPQPTDTHEGVGIEDEYDEKLFDIFMDQLVDGLQVLIQESLKMPPSMDDEDPFLRYRDRLGTLRASAIYMGYDKLKHVYVQWEQSLAAVEKQLKVGDQIDWDQFVHQTTSVFVERVKHEFPRAARLQQIKLSFAETPSTDEVYDVADENRFVVDDQCFDHIGIDIQTETPTIALSEEGENSSDPVLSSNNSDSVERFEEIVDEYDEELFGIFVDQLKEGLQAVLKETQRLCAGEQVTQALHQYEEQLTTLYSSANYMGYEALRQVYGLWSQSVSQATEQHNNGQSVDWMLFADEVTWNNMRRVASFFPKIESVQALLVSAQAFIEQQASPGEDEPLVQVALGAFEATSVSERVSHGDTALMVDHAAAQYEAQAEIEDLTSRLAAITEATEAYTQVDTESFDGTQTADIDQEQSLLLRLENAFDANLVGLADSSLLSEEEIELFKGMLSEGTEIPDEPVSWSTDREIESWLFSDGKLEDAPWQSMLLPKPLDKPGKKSSQEGLRSIGDEQHPSQIYPGRRQTDTTRERLIKQSIRVEAGKIDMLMNKVGELVVMRAGFSQMLEEMRELQLMLKQRQRLDIKEMQPVKKLTHRLNEATVSLSRVAAELQENVMKMRMLPITHLFSRYPRVVHELVRNISKQVTLETHGEKTELDRMVIEQISDPLVHIIRNAVDHGIEEIEERRRNGKPESGTVHLDAYHEGNSVVIEISDDGRGIDPEMIKAKAIQDGFVQPEELSAMSTEEILEIIMRPGFSTSEEVTHTSGRGVGMDVVKDNIERLNGTIKIESTPGIRTMIRIRIPLTLAIIQALMVRVSGVQFSIPLSAVDETIRIGTADVFTLEDMEVYDLRETNLPLIRLARIFKIADTQTDAKEHFIVVVRTGNRQVGLIVDQLQGKEDVVIKPLEDYLQEKSGFCGATILGDGSISLILDVAEVFHMSMLQNKC